MSTEYLPQSVAKIEAEAIYGEYLTLRNRGGVCAFYERKGGRCVAAGRSWVEAIVRLETVLVELWIKKKALRVVAKQHTLTPEVAVGLNAAPGDVTLYAFADVEARMHVFDGAPKVACAVRSPWTLSVRALCAWWRQHRSSYSLKDTPLDYVD